MTYSMRTTSILLILGGLLIISRIFPVMLGMPEGISFPPVTTDDTALMVLANIDGWVLSRILTIAGFFVCFLAYFSFYKRFQESGQRMALPYIASGVSGFTLFSISQLIDIAFVPYVSEYYRSTTSTNLPIQEFLLNSSFQLSYTFEGSAIILMSLTLILIAVLLIKTRLVNVIVAGLGCLIGTGALFAHVILPITHGLTGSVTMLFCLWTIILGGATYLRK